MVNTALAETSTTLFHAAFLTYIVAMVGYFFRLAFTHVRADGTAAGTRAGTRVGQLGTALAVLGVALHAGSVLTRGLSVMRVPLGNMYEYSSFMALVAIAVGLLVVQRRMGYGHVMGFVLAAGILMMASGLLLFVEASPVMPALQSYWLKIHVSSMMASGAIFMVAFAVTALYLVKDTAERRVFRQGRIGASSVGAAKVAPPEEDRPPGYEADGDLDGRGPLAALAQRDVLSPVLFPVVPFLVVGVFTLVVWRAPAAALIASSVAALLGTAAWYAVPTLPSAARLDNLAYRVIAFGFPIFTFGVIAGAIWAEEAWGRYWGWDPKETGSFFTWTLYAAYLHARSTVGWRGRRAAWVAVTAFVALMVTYYAVNLWVVGLHSYAGV
ncbi:MAG TPA: c-type cytochrome biogenesis protein CcsB [Egibacteraceae bacterium]|nr:c-type cytochrome biogenesis protein CcsB [Egibacteraceae bacterium]